MALGYLTSTMVTGGDPTATATDPATQTGGGSGTGTVSTVGAATYYGAVALAIVILVAVTVISRIVYTRRQRAIRNRERMELQQRGEAGGLPTYRETVNPELYSYITHPFMAIPARSIFSRNRRGTNNDPNAQAEEGIAAPEPAYHPDDPNAPPAYGNLPPKYEDAVVSTTHIENSTGRAEDAGIEMQERATDGTGRELTSAEREEQEAIQNARDAISTPTPSPPAPPPPTEQVSPANEQSPNSSPRSQQRRSVRRVPPPSADADYFPSSPSNDTNNRPT